MRLEEELQGILQKTTADGLYRQPRLVSNAGTRIVVDGLEVVNFSSNDYLGLSRDWRVLRSVTTALQEYGSSATSARLVSGNFAIHQRLQEQLAQLKATEASLLFGAGYLANISTIASLLGRHDVAITDKLCHASLIDGVVQSRAKHLRFRHNDIEHLQQQLIAAGQGSDNSRVYIIVESVYSMDGDIAPLAEIFELAIEHRAVVIVDEAHAIGVFGRGRGVIVDVSSQLELIQTATLSKAFAAYGGVCFASETVCRFLTNKARSFIFNTGLPPASAAAALAALEIIQSDETAGQRLLAKAGSFAQRLAELGLPVGNSRSQIIPIAVGDNQLALRAAAMLLERGILAVAIRPPTVPEGSARLRLSICASHTQNDLEQAAVALHDVFFRLGLRK